MSPLEHLAEGLWLGVLLLDAEAQVAFANDTACKLLGCARADELRDRWCEVMSRLGLSRADLAEVAPPLRIKAELCVAEGTRALDLEVLGLEPEARGGHLILLRDIRALDPLEAELVLASRMRAQKYLLAAMAHDMADPMNALYVALEALKAGLEDGVEAQPVGGRGAQRCHYLEVLDAELSRLKQGIQALRGHADLGCTKPDSIDLSALAEECLRILQQPARLRRVKLLQSPAGPTAAVQGIGQQIKQSLLNIMTFVIETMPEAGQLLVEIRGAEGAVEVQLRGDGSNVPTEMLHALYRIDGLTKSMALDPRLYLARRLAESNGGEFFIDQNAGPGACFCLRFPSQPAKGFSSNAIG